MSSSSETTLFNQPGNILISDQFNNRVIEVTPKGEVVWSYGLGPNNFTPDSIFGVTDAQRVGSRTLMSGAGILPGVIPEALNGIIDNRVLLVNKNGNIIWQYGQFGFIGTGFNLLNRPVQAVFIPRRRRTHTLRGRVLITDQGNNRVIEVNDQKEITWEYPGPNINPSDQLNSPWSAQKLSNRNILIADGNNNRAIEVDKNHVVINIYDAEGTLGECGFASRLPNGNTLLTDIDNNKIVEVDINNNIVWQYITNLDTLSVSNPNTSRGIRLNNGDTIISDPFNNRIIKINEASGITGFYGLPLTGMGSPIGANKGYNINTTQLGLYCPHDAKVIGDYTTTLTSARPARR